MLRIGDRIPSVIHIGRRRVAMLTVGAMLVWQSVRSCFGSGRWTGRRPWLGKERWRNSK